MVTQKVKEFEKIRDQQLEEWGSQIDLPPLSAKRVRAGGRAKSRKSVEHPPMTGNETGGIRLGPWAHFKGGMEKFWGQTKSVYRAAAARFF